MTPVEIVSAGCLISGALLSLFGALGLVRLPDIGGRLQAATKLQVPGLLLILLGVGLLLVGTAEALQLLIVALFQLVTAPVIAQLVGRAAYRAGHMRADLMAVDDLRTPSAREPGEQTGERDE